MKTYLLTSIFITFAFAQNTTLGVGKCYVCIEECGNPPEQHDCREVLTPIEGREVEAACFSYEITLEGSVSVFKGCVPENDLLRETCSLANIVYPEITCTICNTDLCNGQEEDTGDHADECYFCEYNCDHLLIQNCTEALGEGVKGKCLTAEIVLDGQKIESRRCIEDEAAQTTCNVLIQQGGNCTICDTNLCNDIKNIEDETDDNSALSTNSSLLLVYTLVLIINM